VLACALIAAAFMMIAAGAPAGATDVAVVPPTCTSIPNTLMADSPDGTFLGLQSEGWLSGALASDAWHRDHCVFNGTGYDVNSGAYSDSGLSVSVAGTLHPGTSTLTISATDGYQTRKWRDLTDPAHPTYMIKQHILANLAPNGGAHNNIVYGITAYPLGPNLYGLQPLQLGDGTLDPGANYASCSHAPDAGGSTCTYTVTIPAGTPAFEGYISLDVLAAFVDPTSYPTQDAGEYVDPAFSPAVIPHIQVPIAYTGEAAPPVLTLSSITTDPANPLPGQPFSLDMAIRNDSDTDASDVAPAPLSLSPAADLHLNAGPTPTSVATLAPGATTHFSYQLTADRTEQVSVIGQASATIAAQSVSTAAQTRLIGVGAGLSATLAGPPDAPVKGIPFHVTATVTNGTSDAQDVVPGPLTAGSATGFTASAATPDLVRLASGASTTFDYEATETEPGTLALSADIAAHDVSSLVDSTVTAHGTIDVSNGKIVVTTTGDQDLLAAAMDDSRCDVDSAVAGDQCTLRAAIALANHRDDAESIAFDIPGGGVPVIAPTSALPVATSKVSIDGTTQPGGWVQLAGNAAGTVDGLSLAIAESSVRGLAITGWAGVGLRVTGASSTVAGNRIGTADAVASAANHIGVLVDAPGVTIGGTNATSPSACAGDCNLISGNASGASLDIGVLVCAHGGGAAIDGNWIGLDATGNGKLPNRFGIDVDSNNRSCSSGFAEDEPAGVTIGGSTARTGAAPGNVISSNGTGVILGTGRDARISGNLIGTNAAGSAGVYDPANPSPHGIATYAVEIASGGGSATVSTVIGGATADLRNVISAQTVDPTLASYRDNFDQGAPLGSGVYGAATVIGDYIGTDITGTRAIPNDQGVVDLVPSFSTAGAGSVANSVVSGNGAGLVGTNVGGSGSIQGFTAVTGNRIGTTSDGTAAIPNILGVSSYGAVGGIRAVGDRACDGPCNLISGNSGTGVIAQAITGNFIGTDVTGARAIPNSSDPTANRGAVTAAAIGADIGGVSGASTGLCDQACNLISGNRSFAAMASVVDSTVDSFHTRVRGNVIGLASTGAALGNGAGINTNFSDITVGGDGAGEGNVIVNNAHYAVFAATGTTLNPARPTLVEGNVITANGSGISYGAADFGPDLSAPINTPGLNNEPPAPIMHDTTGTAGVATLTGAVPEFTAGDALSYRIDVYANTQCDSTPQGAIPLLHKTFGLSSSTGFSLDVPIPTGAHYLTTTVTVGDNTSRFSGCIAVTPPPPAAHVSSPSVPAGGAVEVTGSDFSPGENVTLILHSDPVLLGTAAADAQGNVDAIVTIPVDTEPGLHHLELTGLTSGLTVSIPITVTAAPTNSVSPGSAPASPAPASPASASSALASTGSPIVPMLVLAVLLVLSGLALNRARRSDPR
jgi:hypothetical protein